MAFLGDRAPGHSLLLQLRSVVESATVPASGRGPRPWLTAEAKSWHDGILGELAVARALDGLPPRWMVLHSVPVGEHGTDIDHVVVSPGGHVMTVNTKNHRNRSVWVGAFAILIDGHKQSYLPKSRSEAAQAGAKLGAAVGARVPVSPVIVFVEPRSFTVKQQPEGVAVTTAGNLVRTLIRLDRHEGTVSADAVRRAASESTTWSGTALDSTSSADLIVWFMTLRRPRVPSERAVRAAPSPTQQYRAIRPSGRPRRHPLALVAIVVASLFGVLWTGGMVLGALARIGL